MYDGELLLFIFRLTDFDCENAMTYSYERSLIPLTTMFLLLLLSLPSSQSLEFRNIKEIFHVFLRFKMKNRPKTNKYNKIHKKKSTNKIINNSPKESHKRTNEKKQQIYKCCIRPAI